MLCPRCNKHILEEREQDGVTIDICQECRGVWLDRGELERLMARATRKWMKAENDGQSGAYQAPMIITTSIMVTVTSERPFRWRYTGMKDRIIGNGIGWQRYLTKELLFSAAPSNKQD